MRKRPDAGCTGLFLIALLSYHCAVHLSAVHPA